MPDTAHADIEGRALVGDGEPVGVPFDREDAPQLAREIDALAGSLKTARPERIVFSAELALRVHSSGGRFGRGRRTTLALGWPLLQILDADELRAACALAVAGEVVRIGPSAPGASDERIAARVGRPLLARTLTRLLVAEPIGAAHWWCDWNQRARLDGELPARALDQLRNRMEARGRARWGSALDRCDAAGRARADALGGASLAGGSHRGAASALFWEGMITRMWTALEQPFAELLAPAWRACFEAHAGQRQRARELDALRRGGHIDLAGQIELAGHMERLAGARAAYPLYREAYARERRPELALALARTMLAVDAGRARDILARLAAGDHAVAGEAGLLLSSLPATESVSP